MTTRDPDNTYGSLQQALRFLCDRLCRTIHTSLPAIVVDYTPATRRATVQPAVHLLIDRRAEPRAPLLDVPVLWPGTSTAIIHGTLTAGDTVLVLFCERDITAFKQTFEAGAPATDRAVTVSDAVAIPTFGSAEPLGGTPPSGLTITTVDGDTRVTVADNKITLRADQIELDYQIRDHLGRGTRRTLTYGDP